MESLAKNQRQLQKLPNAGKRSSSTSEFETRHFYIKENMLFYAKNDSILKIRGQLDLSFCYITVSENENSGANLENISQKKYVLSIERGQRFTSVQITGKLNLKIWLNELAPYCIQEGLHEHYEAVKQIGEGAFGKVYKVIHKGDTYGPKGSISAAKALTKKNIKDKHKETVYREIEAMRRVRGHELFIQLHGIFESENTIYMVVEYIDGTPLLDLCEMEVFPEAKRLPILDQMLQALKILQKKRLVHRDLKPDNIMLTTSGQVKVIDFGLCLIDSEDQAFLRAGTPGFIAPEVLQSSHKKTTLFNISTDLYAVGVIYYCMATAEHPFDADDADGVLLNNRNGFISFNNDKKKCLNSLGKLELELVKKILQPNQETRSSLDDSIAYVDQIIDDQLDTLTRSETGSKLSITRRSNKMKLAYAPSHFKKVAGVNVNKPIYN